MLKRLDNWISDNVPWSPGFSIALATLTAIVTLAGGEPLTGIFLIGACIWLAFR